MDLRVHFVIYIENFLGGNMNALMPYNVVHKHITELMYKQYENIPSVS